MPTPMKIDFVSDVACPWCIIGLNSLRLALRALRDEVDADITFRAFELNPDMPAEGQDLLEYMASKYRMTPPQVWENQEMIRRRGAEVGFQFNMGKRTRAYNTFSAHRLLYWAGQLAKKEQLKRALFSAYFCDGLNPGDHGVLRRLAGEVGLDLVKADEILQTGAFTAEVRSEAAFCRQQGIHSIPSVIIDSQYLIQGGQSPAVFEQYLRRIAAA